MSNNITVKHLRAFVAVARLNSFTRAAEELSLSQPALTMAIRQLEAMIGTSLFDRTTRRVIPTPEGSDFIATAERLLREFDSAFQEVRIAAQRRRGRVAIASVNSVARRILPGVIREFSDAFPDISLHLRDGNSTEVCRHVRENEADIGFATLDRDNPDLESTDLFRDQLGLLARKDHALFRTKRMLTWRDLAEHDFLGLARDTSTSPLLRKIPNPPPSVLSPRYQVSNVTTLVAMLEAGIGITAVGALTGALHKKGPLEFRAVSAPVLWRTVSMVTRRGRSLSRPAQLLVGMVSRHIQRMNGTHELVETVVGDTEPSIQDTTTRLSSPVSEPASVRAR